MSHVHKERTFWFRGNAVAFGGQITTPFTETLDACGATVLPPTGGFASASVGRFDYRDIVSFERASSTAAGSSSEHRGRRTYDTIVTVMIEGLNVLNMVTADRVVARMTSKHPEDTYDPEMRPVGSYFENLRIGGIPVEPTPRSDLMREGGYSSVMGKFSKEELPDLTMRDWQPGVLSPVFQDRRLLVPLFETTNQDKLSECGIDASAPGRMYVPEFGMIYFGEYLVSRFSRRLTMLRIDLGCAVEGTMTFGSEETNGHPVP